MSSRVWSIYYHSGFGWGNDVRRVVSPVERMRCRDYKMTDTHDTTSVATPAVECAFIRRHDWLTNAVPVRATGSCPQSFDPLGSNVRDQIEILVQLQHGQSGQFSGRGDDQIRDRRPPMLASVGK